MKDEFDWDLLWIIVLGSIIGIYFIGMVILSIINPVKFKKETKGVTYFPVFIYMR